MQQRTRVLGVMIATFGLCILPAVSRTIPARPALFGEMKLGPHAVGFRIMTAQDPTRPLRGDTDYLGKPHTTDGARVLRIHVWYPAASNSAAELMTVEAYLNSGGVDADGQAAQRRGQRNFLTNNFGAFSDEVWARYLAEPLLARCDAPVAVGKFPLLIGQLRPFSTTLTNEFLASHGYVVAMVQGPRRAPGEARALFFEEIYRDIEFAWSVMRAQPEVDGSRVGAIGFSGAGFGQVLFAMRNPHVDALVDLESAFFDSNIGLRQGNALGYDPRALRVPFLHTYGVPLSATEDLSDFRAMKFSTRYRYLVDAPNLHHWDFATEGIAASTVLGLRGDAAPRLRAVFELTNLYVLQFLNAYLKGDAQALAFLSRKPEENGALPGLATVEILPGVKAAPTPNELVQLLHTYGPETAVRALRDGRGTDPDAAVFVEQAMNNFGYDLLGAKHYREAIQVFEMNAERYPQSSNALDSLADACEAAGEKSRAIAISERALLVLAAEKDLSQGGRRQIEAALRERLQRLKH